MVGAIPGAWVASHDGYSSVAIEAIPGGAWARIGATGANNRVVNVIHPNTIFSC